MRWQPRWAASNEIPTVKRRSARSLVPLVTLALFVSPVDTTIAQPTRDDKGNDGVTRDVPYKVWFNHDGTNMLTCISPWHQPGEPFSEQMLEASIDELAGIGVDAVAFNPGNGAIPWWPSEVYPDHWQWYTERTGKRPGSFGRYVVEGGDMIRVFVDRCRRHNLAPFVTLRLKDEHGINKLDNEWVSKFFFEHQHLRLNRDPRAVFGERGLNWIYPVVPQERLAIIRELCESYDLAGVELDFMRFYPYFDLEQTTAAQRRDVMTGFIREVRRILDDTGAADSKRYLAIRIPNRVGEYANIGLDLPLLDREGLVDIINLSPSYVSQVESDLVKVRALAPAAAIFYELTQCAARGPSPSWGMYGDDYPVRYMVDEQYYTAANLAYARGADGVSLFNFVYTRGSSRTDGEVSVGFGTPREPPFHVIKPMRDPLAVANRSQLYWIPYWWKTGYNGRQFQLPRTFEVGSEHTLELDMELPESGATRARMRIMAAGGTPVLSASEPLLTAKGTPGLTWRAWINDVPLTPSDDVSEPFENRYGGFTGVPEMYAAWKVDPSALRDGQNKIRIELADGPISDQFNIDVIWLDLAVLTDEGSPLRATSAASTGAATRKGE